MARTGASDEAEPARDDASAVADALSEGRLELLTVDRGRASARFHGDDRTLDVGYDEERGWWCECGDAPDCVHVRALRIVSERAVDPTAAPRALEDERPRRRRLLGEARTVLLLVLVAILAKAFVLSVYRVPSGSMEPTFEPGDRILVVKLSYWRNPPRRGDVIVFEDPAARAKSVSRSPLRAVGHWFMAEIAGHKEDFVKRVVGLPGETVEIRKGVVLVNGRPLTETYLGPFVPREHYGPVSVPPGRLFVLGDNRANSQDSRFGLGFVPYDHVVGRVVTTVWPPSRFEWIRGD